MSLKIVCPHCQHVATLKTWKAGTFKPQCSQCKQPFLLKISADEPPKLDVRLIPNTVSEPSPKREVTPRAAAKPAPTEATKGPAELEQTLVQTIDAPLLKSPTPAGLSDKGNTPGPRTPAAAPERTAVPSAAVDLKHRGAEVTVAPEQTRAANPEATLDSYALDSSVAKTSPSQVVRSKSSVPVVEKASASTAGMKSDLPEKIGGYRVVEELGRGGMGAVYLARQLSLDRPVALKTIQAQWASDPRVIARFIREAYAAGQLTHNNVVQIYDLGQDGGTNFFSMELVPGGSLSDLLKKQGRLEPAAATAMILQAARGLKYAHDHGMVHRDIKPANLMISVDGLVKVADLGLVKTPAMDEEADADSDRSAMLASANASVTGVGSTMGTPAYMSPEQASDATSVDHRADIYSLGCTFYALLTGSPPFQGASAIEVVSKHRSEPIQRPDSVVESVPKALGDIVERMTAKSPIDRYQDMSEVIVALEAFLNKQQAKQPLLTDSALATELEAACRSFNQEGLASIKQWVPIGYFALSLIMGIALLAFHWRLGATLLLAAVVTVISHLTIAMFSPHQAPVAKRLRSLIWLSPWTDWLTWAVGLIVFLLMILVTGLWPYALGAIAVGGIIGWGYDALILKVARTRRTRSVELGEQIVKRLRLAGIDEQDVQRFVARFSGRQWEEYFAALFDYDLVRSNRQQLIASGQHVGKARFQPWRDTIVDRLDAKLAQRREENDQKLLTRVEQASLTSQGFSVDQAKEQAEQMAQMLVSFASQTRSAVDATLPDQPRASVEQKRAKFKAMMAEARSGKFTQRDSLTKRATRSLINHLFGGKYRFLLGSILLIGSILWAKQNGFFDPEVIDSLRSTANSVNDSLADAVAGGNTDTSIAPGSMRSDQVANAFQELGNSDVITKATKPFLGIFTHFGQAVIGFLIVVMSLMDGWRVSIATTVAAFLVLFGPSMFPDISYLSATVSSFIASLVVLILGGYLLRTKEVSV